MAQNEERAFNEHPEENQYPLQTVHQFEGGLRMVIGNQKKKQYIALFHPSGTHMTIKPDGSMSSFVVGDSKTYHKGGASFTVDESGDAHYAGHMKLHVEGGSHVEVAGDANIVTGGNVLLAGMGNMGMAIKGNAYFATNGSMNFNAAGGFNLETSSANIKADAMAVNVPATGWEGNINQKGSLTSSGEHKASAHT